MTLPGGVRRWRRAPPGPAEGGPRRRGVRGGAPANDSASEDAGTAAERALISE
jgi:hypothetical protein